MIKLQSIDAAEWTGGLSFRLRFADGWAGVADLAAEPPPASHAARVIAATASSMRVVARGRALVWTDADGEEVDIDAETLRGLRAAERAAAE